MKNRTYKNLLMLFLTLSAAGCAGMAIEKEFTERGYSEKDREAISKYRSQYLKQMVDAGVYGNRLSGADRVESEKRVRKVWCNCFKKLGKRCQQKPAGLTGDDYELWAKGNGAEVALRTSNFDRAISESGKGDLDEAQCD